MHETIQVSVIVPCRNEQASIEACVRSILAQEDVPGCYEVLVADGMSQDGTRAILQRLEQEDKRLRLIDNPAGIVSTGLNAAIRAARGTVILRMDAHTVYAPDYIRQSLAVLHETGAANVGGPALTHSTGYIQAVIGAAFHAPFAVGGGRFHDPTYEGAVDTVPYGCWPREIFQRVGLFDEELVRNQDDEFNLRLRRAGGIIWQSPRIRSWYRPRRSLLALSRQYYQYGYWKVRVIQKHRGLASLRHVVPGSFVSLALILPVLGWRWRLAWVVWLGLLGVYGVSTVTAALLTAARSGWRLLPLLPVVFGCYHISYGLGFLHGVWAFLLCPRLRQYVPRVSRVRARGAS
ncbi:MAG: glycosyltransferase family 2 protein [Candidatus Tectimicrobiota bacterium]